MKKRTDIDKILLNSTLKDISDMLVNPEKQIEDVLVIYINGRGNVRLTGTVDFVSGLGLISLAESLLLERSWEAGTYEQPDEEEHG